MSDLKRKLTAEALGLLNESEFPMTEYQLADWQKRAAKLIYRKMLYDFLKEKGIHEIDELDDLVLPLAGIFSEMIIKYDEPFE